MEVSNIPAEKISVIYEAAGEQFKIQDQKLISEFKKKYDLPNNFVLAMSGVGERRNLKRVKEATKDFNLVIAGETIPFVSADELPLLYGSADVLLYPSFYEGFGLPILEAMGCGTAVITSNVSSMPEVGGEAAIYVSPDSLEDIKGALKDVMEDKELKKDLIKKGFEQSKKFSWQKCAKETADVYFTLSE